MEIAKRFKSCYLLKDKKLIAKPIRSWIFF
jgi:hypothetical protein